MSRTTIGYFLMAIIAGGVLWGVLRIGSHLQAPPDWSGTWQVIDATTTAKTVSIEQSGVFVVLQVEHQPAKPYKLVDDDGRQMLESADQQLHAKTVASPQGTELTLTDPVDASHTLRLWQDKSHAPR